MERGREYTFHFSINDVLGVPPSQDSVMKAIRGDSNFVFRGYKTLPATIGSKEIQVSVLYNGQGSSIGDAGSELQNIINSNANFVAGAVTFSGVDIGAIQPGCNPSCGPGFDWTWIIVGAIVVVLITVVVWDAEKLKDLGTAAKAAI